MSFTVELTLPKSEIQSIKKRLKDVEPPLVTFTREKDLAIRKQFKTFTDPDGKPWKELKEKTIKRKRVNKNKILTHYGAMKKSLRRKTENLGFRIWFESKYAIYHQTGTKKMSQRKILGITNREKIRIKKLITVWVTAKGN